MSFTQQCFCFCYVVVQNPYWGWKGRGGGVYCLLEVPEWCNCQVNVLQCTLKGVETVVGKYTRRKSVPLGYCSWKKTVFVIPGSCGRLIFVCICVGGWILFGCVRASGIGWD